MANSIKATIASRTLLFTKIVAAIAQYLTAAIVLGGKSVTPQALSALYQAYLASEQDLEAARTVVATKQQARDAALAAVDAVQPALQKYLAATYGEESATYTAFGLPVAKKATKTTQVKAAAAVKSAATRAAHTKQETSPAAPAASPAPAVVTPSKS